MSEPEATELVPPPAPGWLAPVALRLALLAGMFVVVVSALQWVIADLLGSLAMMTLSMAAWPLLLVSLLLSGLTFVLSRRAHGGRETRPLLVSLLTFGLVVFVPWTWLDLEARWRLLGTPREGAVAMVRDGRLTRGAQRLPPGLRAASAGGGVVVVGDVPGDSLSVRFYTFRGQQGHWSAFLYTALDRSPAMSGDDTLLQVVTRAPHWYFVASK
jgi:hypothetical protein